MEGSCITGNIYSNWQLNMVVNAEAKCVLTPGRHKHGLLAVIVTDDT
jgi:hypothetical protein